MSDKLTSEKIAGIERAVGLTICDTWSSDGGHSVEGRISAKDFTDLRRHITALEAENAQRDQALFRFAFFHGSEGMGIDQEYAAKGVDEFNRQYVATHPTSQTVKDHGND